jgi:hypothetical protein
MWKSVSFEICRTDTELREENNFGIRVLIYDPVSS